MNQDFIIGDLVRKRSTGELGLILVNDIPYPVDTKENPPDLYVVYWLSKHRVAALVSSETFELLSRTIS